MKLTSSRDLFLSVRTLDHFSRQLAVQSLHHLIYNFKQNINQSVNDSNKK